MSAGGIGIPRLQEISLLEVTALAVAEDLPFEQIRREQIEHRRLSSEDPSDTKWMRRFDDKTRDVHNVVDSLKELMRLGMIDRADLPSTPKSAWGHADRTFSLAPLGQAWVELLRTDRASAYNSLTGRLIGAHPQFESYLRLVGTRPDSASDHFTVPLLPWSEAPQPPDHDSYLDAFVDSAARLAAAEDLGWTAEAATIREGVRDYVTQIGDRAKAHGREPFSRTRTFLTECEKGLVKVAFAAAGVRMDYITVELLRRWTRFLGLASFSYHADQPHALRLWGTAIARGTGDECSIDRRVGDRAREQVLTELADVFSDRRRTSGQTMYLPIWEARAAVCWRLRIAGTEFDRAIIEMLGGSRGAELPWEPHLDQASLGAMPPSSEPLVITTRDGMARAFNVINLVPRPARERTNS